jgi:glutathione S-transferase
MKLYEHPFSSACFKVRAVLHELGLPCELVTIDMAKGQHKSPEHLARNPNGKVPVLEDDGFLLWESNAIITYLAAKVPERGLLPLDARGLASVQQWLQWQATQYGPAVTKVMMETVYAKAFGRPRDEEKLAAGLKEVERDLAVLEKSLEGKEYLCGKLSLADFSVVSGLQLRQPMGVDLTPFPKVKAWVERMEARASVRKSLPPM